MAVLKILEYPDPFLACKAKPVEQIDEETLKLIDDMADTMFDAPGVGLAATQVGVDKRIIVYNPSAGLECYSEEKEDEGIEGGTGEEDKIQQDDGEGEQGRSEVKQEARAIINPEIISASGSLISESEACLSVPNFDANVKRFSRVTVKGLNVEGKKIQFDADDIQAVILQHEIDHLDGILYIDRISVLKRNMYKKRLKKKHVQKKAQKEA